MHVVQVVQVVLQVELVEPERGEEGGDVRGVERGAEEGEGEIRSAPGQLSFSLSTPHKVGGRGGA